MQIGIFTPSKNGGWIGSIRTLTTETKIRLVPNDDRTNDKAPAFHILVGGFRVGEAWEAKTIGSAQKTYLRLRFDDPLLSAPLSAALFPTEDGTKAQLIWNRYKEDKHPP